MAKGSGGGGRLTGRISRAKFVAGRERITQKFLAAKRSGDNDAKSAAIAEMNAFDFKYREGPQLLARNRASAARVARGRR